MTDVTVLRPARRPRAGSLVRAETKLLLRDPGSLFTVVIPIFLLVVFGGSLGAGAATVLPSTIATAVGLVGLYLVPTTLASYREKGILRRLSTTPLRPIHLLAVQLLLQFALAFVSCGLLVGVAVAFLGASAPVELGWLVLVVALGTAAMIACGLLIAAFAPSGRAANGIGVLLYFPMAYVAGLIVPAEMLPAAVRTVGEFTPLGALRQGMAAVWAGDAPPALSLIVMAAYAVCVSLTAARFFRWE